MSEMDVFKNVPVSRQIEFLYSDDRVVPKEIVTFLGLTRADIALALDIGVDSVRFDKMTVEMDEYFNDVANICELAANNFNRDLAKTKIWLGSINPALENKTPIDLIKSNRVKDLLLYIYKSPKNSPADPSL